MENSRPAAVEDEGDHSGSSDQFMLHVLLVLVVTWLLSSLRLNNVFFLCLCVGYLWLVSDSNQSTYSISTMKMMRLVTWMSIRCGGM